MKGFCFFFLLLSSCGYDAGHGGILSSYQTLDVPYVSGDLYGELTEALVKEISCSGAFSYDHQGAQMILYVKLEAPDYRNIGFRFDRKKDEEFSEKLIQTEGRLIVRAHVEVVDAENGNTLIHSVLIEESLDFDHDFYSSRDEINVLSLGQVSEIEEARLVVLRALYSKLAKKIVAHISAVW